MISIFEFDIFWVIRLSKVYRCFVFRSSVVHESLIFIKLLLKFVIMINYDFIFKRNWFFQIVRNFQVFKITKLKVFFLKLRHGIPPSFKALTHWFLCSIHLKSDQNFLLDEVVQSILKPCCIYLLLDLRVHILPERYQDKIICFPI